MLLSKSLPPYQVQVSARAKSVRLTVTRERGLVVTIPCDFNPSLLPGILAEKQDWIEKSIQKVQAEPEEQKLRKLPGEFNLLAVPEVWQIVYKPAEGQRLTVKAYPSRVLIVTGKVSDQKAVRAVLDRWLRQRAQQILPAWLHDVSNRTGLSYRGLTIRNQHTRWGSCSARRQINLNQKLLFLPQELVEYVMIHELCHTLILSHSHSFWNLVGKYLPDYASRRKQLRRIEKQIPW